MNYRNKKLLEAVRQLPCQVCGIEDGTVVAAHSNQLRHGKGKGIKAHDWAIAAMCHGCHANIDQGKDLDKQTRFELWDRAFQQTLHLLWERGIIEVRSQSINERQENGNQTRKRVWPLVHPRR